MSSSTPRSQKTEQPTGRRLSKAREEGQTPRSKEVPSVTVLGGFLVFAYLLGPGWMNRLRELMASSLQQSGQIELNDASMLDVLNSTAASLGLLLVMPLGLVAASGVAGHLIQGPPTFTLKPLRLKFDKLNPITGIKKVISLKQWVELLKGVLKMALYGSVSYAAAKDIILRNPAGMMSAEGTFQMLVSLAASVMLHGAALAAALAVLDVLFRRYEHSRDLRMSKQEVKEELKDTHGDPMVRARIRRKQMALSRSRMMADVAKATVVVTNPEHVAVALRYVQGESGAPRVLAKGRALLAARIRKIAAEHGVPIVSEPPLARALYRSVPVGAEIPAAFFRAVAEILALVLSRKARRSRATRSHDRARP